jgi:hypothetical protein
MEDVHERLSVGNILANDGCGATLHEQGRRNEEVSDAQ